MNSKYREFNLKEMQAWNLDKKINHSLKRIQEFYKEMDGKTYVAFSGGIDSTILLHLVRSLYPDVVAVFSNTTNEYMEILEFVRTIENCIEVKPKMTFIETVSMYGFPLVSKKVSRQIHDLKNPTERNTATLNLYLTGMKRDGTKSKNFKLSKKWVNLIDEVFDITNKCCDVLKKEPMGRYSKETGFFPYIGTQTEESGQRKQSWVQTGCNSFEKGKIQSKPMSIWTKRDIWDYQKRYNLPYATIYDDVLDEQGNILIDKELRTGCAYCAFGAHLEKGINRFQRLSLRKPKQFKKMMNLKNNGIRFETALNKIGVKTTVGKSLFGYKHD